YDGGKRPPKELLDGKEPESSGALVIGEKGKLYSPGDSGDTRTLLGDVTEVRGTYPQSPGHFCGVIRAIKMGAPAPSNFPDYAGPLEETVLLGNLAVWADGKKIEWDAKTVQAANAPEVEEIVRPKYRQGWKI